jgi:uncharacterized protein YgiM (DUF1202 family)
MAARNLEVAEQSSPGWDLRIADHRDSSQRRTSNNPSMPTAPLGPRMNLLVSNVPLHSNFATESREMTDFTRPRRISFRSKALLAINLAIITLASLIAWKIVQRFDTTHVKPAKELSSVARDVGEIQYAVSSANIRSEASKSGKIVGTLERGDQVRIQRTEGPWKKVYLLSGAQKDEGAYLGYVYAPLLARKMLVERDLTK